MARDIGGEKGRDNFVGELLCTIIQRIGMGELDFGSFGPDVRDVWIAVQVT